MDHPKFIVSSRRKNPLVHKGLMFIICRFDPTREIDENHTVVATARGVFSSVGGVLESPETGVSIVIPQGAIDDGLEQEIYFKVCRDNTILPPLDRDKGNYNCGWGTRVPRDRGQYCDTSRSNR